MARVHARWAGAGLLLAVCLAAVTAGSSALATGRGGLAVRPSHGTGTAGRFSFAIVVRAHTQSTRRATAPTAAPTQHFRSQVDFHPPVVNFGHDPDTSSGEIFIAPDHQQQSGPMIIDPTGHLVWFHPVGAHANQEAKNLQVQTYQGRPVLTWWQGSVSGSGPRRQEDVIMNRSYQTVGIVHAGHGYSVDDHEFVITPQGTALLDAYAWRKADLSGVGGPHRGLVQDYVIQEIDIKTGHVRWEWHTIGHIPLAASYDKPPSSRPFDYCHLNSIQPLAHGDLLVSCRNTWGIYLISKSGKVIWSLGGKYSSFKMGHGTRFEWQHDPRLQGHTLTLFDDAFDGDPSHQEAQQSSVKVLHLNMSTMTATLVHRYTHSPPLLATNQGSAQLLPNHNIFVGWGNQPNFSEFTPSGRQIFDGRLPLGLDSYRAFRFRWAGQPRTPPSMVIVPQRGGAVKVYASWNGATQVVSWRVIGGSGPDTHHRFTHGRRTGFESVLTIHSQPADLEVQALDRHGHVLGTSLPHADPPHMAVFGSRAYVSVSSGYVGLPVGCVTGHACSVTVRIAWRHALVGQSAKGRLAARTGALQYVHLSSRGLSALRNARGQGLRAYVTVRDSSGISTSTYLRLFPYSTSGSRLASSITQSSTVQIEGNTQFVSRSGHGGILAACFAPAPCRIAASIESGGVVVATASSQRLGVDELGDVPFRLTSAGQRMLTHARGNQVGVVVKLSSASATTTGRIALARYG